MRKWVYTHSVCSYFHSCLVRNSSSSLPLFYIFFCTFVLRHRLALPVLHISRLWGLYHLSKFPYLSHAALIAVFLSMAALPFFFLETFCSLGFFLPRIDMLSAFPFYSRILLNGHKCSNKYFPPELNIEEWAYCQLDRLELDLWKRK